MMIVGSIALFNAGILNAADLPEAPPGNRRPSGWQAAGSPVVEGTVTNAAYLKIGTSESDCVIVEVIGDSVRIAPTVKGLVSAKAQPTVEWAHNNLGKLHQEKLLDLNSITNGVSCGVSIIRFADKPGKIGCVVDFKSTDINKVEWQCSGIYLREVKPAGDSPDNAPLIDVSPYRKPELLLADRRGGWFEGVRGDIKLGLVIFKRQFLITKLTRAGNPVEATVSVQSIDGLFTSQLSAPLLADPVLQFRRVLEGRLCTVPGSAKIGDAQVTVEVDMGPFGGQCKQTILVESSDE
jgi:hypothetical protein